MKSSVRRLSFVFVFLATLAAYGCSSSPTGMQTAVVTGRVVMNAPNSFFTTSLAPVTNAEVRLNGYTTMTDANGDFRFDDIRVGRRRLQIRRPSVGGGIISGGVSVGEIDHSEPLQVELPMTDVEITVDPFIWISFGSSSTITLP